MTKLILGILILGFGFSTQVSAAEVQVIKKVRGDRARFLDNYEAKIANLEDYSVTFVSARGQSEKLQKENSRSGGLSVKLLKKVPKS